MTASSETEPPNTPPRCLVSCLLSVVAHVPNTSSDLLKRLNLELLMHTRSEDARVRILALECTTEMWKAEGGKLMGTSSRCCSYTSVGRSGKLDCFFPFPSLPLPLIGFVGETATFISECAEDENDSVVREAHHLKNAVESVAGSISGM